MKAAVALITGCSTGIGRATAATLVAAGYEAVATARKPEDLEGIGAAMALPLDVTDEASIDAAVGAVLERYGRIDVLVNNAGYALRGTVEELAIAAVQRIFNVNAHGIIRVVRAVAPSMRASRSGRIVNISSVAGSIAAPANGAYAATKLAVEALSDALRSELGSVGIAVVLVEPGSIRSSFDEKAMGRSSSLLERRDLSYAALYPGFVAATETLRAREPGPEAVAQVVLAALRAQWPRARYTAAVPLATRVVAILPDWGKDLVMRRMYRLGSYRPGQRAGP